MLTQTSKVSVPSCFIIQDAQFFSHDLTLLSLSSLAPRHCSTVTLYRASGITLAKNGITVQVPFLQTCVWNVTKRSSPCSVCVVVVLWLLCMHARKVPVCVCVCVDGWVTGSTLSVVGCSAAVILWTWEAFMQDGKLNLGIFKALESSNLVKLCKNTLVLFPQFVLMSLGIFAEIFF